MPVYRDVPQSLAPRTGLTTRLLPQHEGIPAVLDRRQAGQWASSPGCQMLEGPQGQDLQKLILLSPCNRLVSYD
jgi:hypothetical protein